MCDIERGLFDVTQIGVTVVAHRRSDCDEDDGGVPQRRADRRLERQPTRIDIAVDEFFETGFEEGHYAASKRLDFRYVVIDADDVIAEFGETRSGDEADIPRPNDTNLTQMDPNLRVWQPRGFGTASGVPGATSDRKFGDPLVMRRDQASRS